MPHCWIPGVKPMQKTKGLTVHHVALNHPACSTQLSLPLFVAWAPNFWFSFSRKQIKAFPLLTGERAKGWLRGSSKWGGSYWFISSTWAFRITHLFSTLHHHSLHWQPVWSTFPLYTKSVPQGLVCLGCHNKTTQFGWLKQQKKKKISCISGTRNPWLRWRKIWFLEKPLSGLLTADFWQCPHIALPLGVNGEREGLLTSFLLLLGHRLMGLEHHLYDLT